LSHSKERKEKICLNCGAGLQGRYCHVCGQENIEPKETVWSLVTHFTYDITHFDGKFFSTVKSLLLKPGFLSREYINGRRAGYLHPIRMYVFTSAFFFIIFFSVFNPGNLIKKDNESQVKELTEAHENLERKKHQEKDSLVLAAIDRTIIKMDRQKLQLEKIINDKRIKDSISLAKTREDLDTLAATVPGMKDVNAVVDEFVPRPSAERDSTHKADSTTRKKKRRNRLDSSRNTYTYDYGDGAKFSLDEISFTSLIAYDSLQKELPEDKKDGWFQRGIKRRTIGIYNKANNNKTEAINLFIERYMHTLPQVLFISLPVFALLLLLLYVRRDHYYVDHVIFTIHLYCATFIFLLVYFGINKIETATGWHWLKYVSLVGLLGIFFYMYKAMRLFYKQGRIRTILKFIILNILSFIVITLLTVLFFVLSLVEF
jgi:hypothetical protein